MRLQLASKISRHITDRPGPGDIYQLLHGSGESNYASAQYAWKFLRPTVPELLLIPKIKFIIKLARLTLSTWTDLHFQF